MIDELLEILSIDPDLPCDPAPVALGLATDEYPDLNINEYLAKLDSIANELRPRLSNDLEANAIAMTEFLYEELGFQGNTTNYYDPRNSFLNDVIDSRQGLPITLTVIAMSVGWRAGLKVHGIGLPGHFIAKMTLDSEEILFDPFNGGQLLDREACEQLITATTGREYFLSELDLAPSNVWSIAMRMLNNLKGIYIKQGDIVKTSRALYRQHQLAPEDASIRRDLGVAYGQSGKPGPAIDHLRKYLEIQPDATDFREIEQLLSRCILAVAKWN